MKLISIIIGAVCFCISNIYCQTTQEEYNYITNGYKVQITNGLDTKTGYSFKDMGNWVLEENPSEKSELRECVFKALVKDSDSCIHAIMMIYQRTDVENGTKLYICIPTPNASGAIWDQTLKLIKDNFKDNNKMMNVVILSLMHLSTLEASKNQ